MNKVTMVSLLNRNVSQNYLIRLLAGYGENEMDFDQESEKQGRLDILKEKAKRLFSNEKDGE